MDLWLSYQTKKDNNGIPKEDKMKTAEKTLETKSGSKAGATGVIAPQKNCESDFIHHDFVHFGNSFRDVRSFCPLLFGHRSIVKISSSHL